MPRLTFVEQSGQEHEVDATPGDSVMQAAIFNSVPGIEADCGGACACATCHVYVDPNWFEKVGPASDFEQEMLDSGDYARPTSRLSCQVEVTEDLDGLRLVVPQSQY